MNTAEKCTKCSKIPDDILMLACSHDLCLPCAARSFAIKRSKREFICEVCSCPTELDATSIYELEKLHLTQTIQEKSNKKQIPKLLSSDKPRNRSQHNKENKDAIISQLKASQDVKTRPSVNMSQRQLSKQMSENSFSVSRPYCSDHPDEELSYYCFECNCKCICPECIIHGVHKNHEVKTIKKAHPVIKKILEDQLMQNRNYIQQIQSNKQEFDKRQAEQTQKINKFKIHLTEEFEILHQILNQKEQEMLSKMDNVPSLMQQYEGHIEKGNEIEMKIRQFSDKISEVLSSKDETHLLNYYASIHGLPVPQIPSMPQIKETVLHQQSILSQINSIKEELTQLQLD